MSEIEIIKEIEDDNSIPNAEENNEYFIKARNISKIFKMGNEKVVALDNVSLDINKGEFVCLLGKSGSGKSTFLNLLAGLEKPSKGSIHIGKVPIHKFSEDRLCIFRQKNTGFIFQSYNLISSMTAVENVALPLFFEGKDSALAKKEARKYLEKVGLKGYENRRPHQMSGGQQQRVGIARALVKNPKIIFADEPTGNLDSKTTSDIIGFLMEISSRSNITIIMVTHDPSLADFADKIVEIRDGKIIDLKVKGKNPISYA